MSEFLSEENHADSVDNTLSSISSSLLERARNKDQESWRLLVDFHAPLVYACCRVNGLDAESARDVGQDVFSAAARSLSTFERTNSQGTFRGWILTITNNKIRDHWKKNNRENQATGGSQALEILHEVPEPDWSESHNAPATKQLFARVLEYAKEHIQPTHWHVVWKLIVEDKTAAEVSEECGLGRPNVYVIKSRVLAQLRTMFLE